MKKHIPFLIHQLARFGALTIPQMTTLCERRFHKSVLYYSLRQLMDQGLVIKLMHPRKHLFAYAATPDAYRLIYGKESGAPPELRIGDLAHTLLVAEAMISAVRFSNVSGIATERELSSLAVRDFCWNRMPDGIIQLTRENSSYELALEVESSIKSEEKTRELLSNYETTLARKMQCSGLIIVAVHPYSFAKYQDAIMHMSEALQKRTRILSDLRLATLDPTVYGERWKNFGQGAGKTLERLRTHSTEKIEYLSIKPIISIDNILASQPLTPIDKDSVRILHAKESLS